MPGSPVKVRIPAEQLSSKRLEVLAPNFSQRSSTSKRTPLAAKPQITAAQVRRSTQTASSTITTTATQVRDPELTDVKLAVIKGEVRTEPDFEEAQVFDAMNLSQLKALLRRDGTREINIDAVQHDYNLCSDGVDYGKTRSSHLTHLTVYLKKGQKLDHKARTDDSKRFNPEGLSFSVSQKDTNTDMLLWLARSLNAAELGDTNIRLIAEDGSSETKFAWEITTENRFRV